MELVVYLLTLSLTVIALLIGMCVNFVGLTKDQMLLASSAISLLIIIFGDRIAAWIRDSNTKKEIKEIAKSIIDGVPQISSIIEYQTSDHAMEYLITRLPYAKVVFNTKISKNSVHPRSDLKDTYVKKIKECLKNGLAYKDIISPGFVEYSKELLQFSESQKGNYQYEIVDFQANSFINFIILEYANRDSELILGWATSSYHGTEQKAYKIRDERLIRYYQDYHSSLYGKV